MDNKDGIIQDRIYIIKKSQGSINLIWTPDGELMRYFGTI